jgi:hypothetical protein
MIQMASHCRKSILRSALVLWRALRLGLPYVSVPVLSCRCVVWWLVRVSAFLGVRACACRFGSVLWSGIVFCNTSVVAT